jgi:hypothetical protein
MVCIHFDPHTSIQSRTDLSKLNSACTYIISRQRTHNTVVHYTLDAPSRGDLGPPYSWSTPNRYLKTRGIFCSLYTPTSSRGWGNEGSYLAHWTYLWDEEVRLVIEVWLANHPLFSSHTWRSDPTPCTLCRHECSTWLLALYCHRKLHVQQAASDSLDTLTLAMRCLSVRHTIS